MLLRHIRALHFLHTSSKASPWIPSLTNRHSFNSHVSAHGIPHHLSQNVNGDCYIFPGETVLVNDFACILDRCRKARDRSSALHLRAYMCDNGLEAHPSLGNHLVAMLAEIGSMYDAQEVFDRLDFPNEQSWASLISGYIKCRRPQEAFKLYDRMQNENNVPFSFHAFIPLLQASANLKDLERGAMIHSDIERRGLLERSIFVASTLVDMYAKCGSVGKAKEVFEKLENRDVVLWNALITGYANHGLGEDALDCFNQMQLEGIFPNSVTFISILKVCHGIVTMEKGFEIHGEITKAGFSEYNFFVSSALVDMYAKCGRLAEARQVFDKLAVKDVVSWTALISGYAEHGPCEKALDCFEQMLSEGVSPDALTFVCSLRACGSIKATEKGEEIHANIKNEGLEKNLFVGSALVDFYGKCGQLDKAQEVFDKLPSRDRVLWSALIAGYVEHGLHEEALKCFYQMQLEGISPDVPLWVCSLKACAGLRDTDKCRQLHAEIERLGLSAALNSALVDMYAKCGLLVTAQEVFDKLPVHDVLSWNVLIAAHAEHGNGEEVFEQFEQMHLEDVMPDSVTFLCILKACGTIGDGEKGIELHAEIERRELLERDLAVGNALVGMYAECGCFNKVREVFDNLPARDIVSWNALIAGYADNEDGDEALRCFSLMESEGVFPDAVTLACILKVCGNDGAAERGQEVHATIERLQLLGKSPLVSSALVNMYAKCGLLMRAQHVFDELPTQEVASWNALLAGYTNHGRGDEALKLLEKFQLKGIPPNCITYLCSLKVFAIMKAIDRGQETHADIARQGLLERDMAIGNTLVDMYAKCGLFANAKKVFDNLPFRDVVSWTAVIAGYADRGDGEEALNCYDKMHAEGVHPNAVTMVCCLKACGRIGATDRGHEFHAEIERKGLLEIDANVRSTLVDMYAQCGSLQVAQEVFDKLPFRGVISWNALISGYVQFGESDRIFSLYDRMIGEGMKPDPVTFLIILNACSRMGLFDRSQTYFEAMSSDYGLVPMLEHHSCVIDLLVRSGWFGKAGTLIKEMPTCLSSLGMWRTILGACSNWGNLGFGVEAFTNAMGLDEMDSAAYVLLSQMYATAGLHEEAQKGGGDESKDGELRTNILD